MICRPPISGRVRFAAANSMVKRFPHLPHSRRSLALPQSVAQKRDAAGPTGIEGVKHPAKDIDPISIQCSVSHSHRRGKARIRLRIDGSFGSLLHKALHAHKQDRVAVYLQFVATTYPIVINRYI